MPGPRSHFRTLAVLLILAAACGGSLGCSLAGPVLSPDGVVKRWMVLKSIPVSEQPGQPDEAAQKAAFARDWLQLVGGEATVQPRPGTSLTFEGASTRSLTWHTATCKKDALDLQSPEKPTEHTIAYAYAEFEEPQARKAYLGLGSDDAVKVWLNGELVHENWTDRPVRLDDDLVPVELETGKNRLLLKVQNISDRWGLACRVMSEDEGEAIRFVHRKFDALAEGDAAAIRAGYHATTQEDSQRVATAAELYPSLARLRKAFDRAYGQGRLVRHGLGVPPGLRLPPRPNFQIDGDRATFSPPGWSKITLIKQDGVWKEVVTPWSEVVARASANGASPLPLERVLANHRVLSGTLDVLAAEIAAGRYLSAAHAYGTLNARLHGLAGRMNALIAGTADLPAPTTRPAASPVPIIELRGDPAAIGKAYGEQLGDAIRLLQRGYMDRFLRRSYSGLTLFLAKQTALTEATKFKPFIRPEHLEEILAMGDAAGLSEREALLGQCFVDLAGGQACSTIAVPASASPDGVARFGRNLDYFSLDLLDRHSVLLIVHPKDRYAYASVTWPGLVGVMSGMNEHGLSLGCMEVPRPQRPADAMPFMLLYRCVLEQCRTVDEAIALLEKTPRQTPHTLMLMDASGDRAVTEITPEKVTVRRARATAALVSTNHHRGRDLDSPGRCRRFDYLHDAARRGFGQLTESSIEELLTGVAQDDMTLQSIIFEPSNRVMYLAAGANAPTHGFARIDLKPYFR